MARILFITPYPHSEAPSQRFRFEQYEGLLEAAGHELIFASFYSGKAWKILYKEGFYLQKLGVILQAFCQRFVLLFTLRKYDFIFIHREMAPLGPPFFEFILAKVLRRSFIYDFDDAIWLPNYSEANSKVHRIKMYKKVNNIMRWADKITAGNAYLAAYARQFNKQVQVIPTTIDTVRHHNVLTNHDANKPIIGWTGSHSTMPYLDFIYPIIAELEKEYDFEFHVISDKAPDFNLHSLKYIPWNKTTEIVDLAKLHIGIMPLEEDEWSEGKCGFKGLQYMALEIVAVMSPVGVNKTIVEHGKNGFLAATPAEWKSILKELLSDVAKRKEIGKNGRISIEENYSVKAQQDQYLALFK